MSRKEIGEATGKEEMLYRLSMLTNKHLVEINHRYQIVEGNDVEDIRRAFLDLPGDKVNEILAEYAEAGSITCYIYVLDDDASSFIKKDSQKITNELRATIQPISDARPIVINEARHLPRFNEIWIDAISLSGKYSYYKFFDEHNKKKPVELQKRRIVENIAVRLNIEHGFLVVRTSDNVLADKVKTIVMSIVGGTADRLHFSNEDVNSILQWAASIRGANFRLEREVSAISMTAGRDKVSGAIHSLAEAGDFHRYREEGELVSVYIHIQPGKEGAHIPDEDEKPQPDEDYIGFRINFLGGKIYFKTALSETEIREKVKEVWANVKIKRPTPSPEYKLYRYIESTRGGESKADI